MPDNEIYNIIFRTYGIKGLLITYLLFKEGKTLWRKWSGDYVSYGRLYEKLMELDQKVKEHLTEDAKRIGELEKDNKVQVEINKMHHEKLDDHDTNMDYIRKSIDDIKTLLIGRLK